MAKGQRVIRTLVEWAAVLLVALGATLLLTSAAAYAECAWVLWATNQSGGLVPVGGFQTRQQCLEAQSVITAQPARCLPDTIDPRSPKGR
jgi:hypothetical protein